MGKINSTAVVQRLLSSCPLGECSNAAKWKKARELNIISWIQPGYAQHGIQRGQKNKAKCAGAKNTVMQNVMATAINLDLQFLSLLAKKSR